MHIDPHDRIRVGIIGYGVGKLYAAAFRSLNYYYTHFPPVDLVGVAAATEKSARQAARHFGFERFSTDYHDLLASPDINVLVIAAPNHLHYPMLVDSLQTDKSIYVDKPLVINLQEARQVLSLAREKGRDAQVIFEFRFSPAVQYARQLIQSGRLGELYSLRAHYYRSSYADPDRPLRWKASAALSGTGVLGDLGSHLIDLVSYLAGSPERVAAQLRTFIPERPAGAGQGSVPVETDDHAILQASLPGGAIGTIEAGRLVTGAVNDLHIEIYGSQGSLRWNVMDPNYLYLADRRMPETERGWLQVPTVQRYPQAALPPADLSVGVMRFHIASAAAFLDNLLAGRPYDPGLEQGARVQAVIEAAFQAAQSGAWVNVPEP